MSPVGPETKRKRGRPPGPRKIPESVIAAAVAPPPPRKPRRAAWSPSEDDRALISRLTSVGVSDEAIAQRFDVSERLLQMRCGKELANGRNTARAELAAMLWSAASKGNVSAMKKLDEMQAAVGAQAAINRDAEDHASRAAEERPVPQGKKDMQRAAAATAGHGSEWGADLSPTTQTQGAA